MIIGAEIVVDILLDSRGTNGASSHARASRKRGVVNSPRRAVLEGRNGILTGDISQQVAVLDDAASANVEGFDNPCAPEAESAP
jgi:hypothetical protein